MKHKKLIIFCLVITVVGLFSKILFAYDDIIIHPTLTGEMAELYNKNFDVKLTDEEIAWMKQGSTDEDKSLGLAIRSENHFYNSNGRKEWVDNSFRKEVVSAPALTSKEWAHDRVAQVTFPGGDYTWETAIKDYAVGDKKRAYEGLGHILHLLEDAAVPAHTRNDLHISPKELEDYNNGSVWKKVLGYYLTDYEPYESWTGNEAKSGGLEFGFAEKLLKENKKPVILDNLDNYFDSMAFYSNNNFFSKDTIYTYSEPNNKTFEGQEKLPNSDIVKYVYKFDDDGKMLKLAKIFINKNTEEKVYDVSDATPEIHSDYWSRLAPNAVLNGAGVIKLFKDEAEKFAKTPKLADLNPLTKVSNDIGRKLEDNTGVVLLRNYFVGKQLVNNLAIYGLKEEAKLASNTFVDTITIINKVSAKEYLRAQEVATEAKMLVSITYNKVKSVAVAQYQRAQEVGAEAKYISSAAYNKAASGVSNVSNFIFSGISGAASQINSFFPGFQTKFSDAGIVSLTSSDDIVSGNNQMNQAQGAVENTSISIQSLSFIGPQLIFGPVLQKPIIEKNITPVSKINDNLIVSVPQNGDNVEVNNLSIEENAENLNNFSPENEQDSIIAIETKEGINNIVPENNTEPNINYPPQIFTSADLSYYSFTSVLTPTPTITVFPTPTVTSVPSLTPDLTFIPTPTPVLEIIPTPLIAPDITPPAFSNLPGKIADLVAISGEKRGQTALSWSVPANAFSYDIIYSDILFNESYASEYFVLNLAADNIASQNLSLDNLAPGKEFFFNVKSRNQEGDISDSSNMASAFSNGYADNIVISEIQIAGNSAKEEFVELFNSTGSDIDLAELPLKLHIVNSAGNDVSKNLDFINTIIKAHSYFLIASGEYAGIADARYSISGNSLVANGAVYISTSGEDKKSIIDLAGWGDSNIFENIAFANIPKNQSMERKAHKDSTLESMISGQDKYQGNAWDSDNNSQDFILRMNPDPRGTSGGYTEPRLNMAPAITIFSPQNNQLFLQGETVNFAADIIDAEDLILPPEKISWTSDKSGIIGNGDSFSFNNFPSGANKITVDTVDSDNEFASAYADIFIRNNSWQNLGQIKDAAKNRNLNSPKIAVDSKGNVHIIAVESVGRGNLVYYTNESGEWKSYNVLKNTDVTINSMEIKIDSHDNIFIIFEMVDCYSYVSYIKKSISGWSDIKYFSSFRVVGYSAAIDANGEIFSTVNAVKPRYLCMNYDDKGFRFSRTVNGILQKEITISAPEKTTIYLPQVAVDKNNIPYLFTSARTGEPGIFYTSFDKSANVFNSWEKINLTFDPVSALPVVPKFDDVNNIHIFIREVSSDPKENRGIWHMASADFKTWTEERLAGTSDINTSWFTKWNFNPMFDSRSKIHLVWQRDKNLVYQTDFGGEWTDPINILGEGIYGMYPALAIDKSNNLHLIYQPIDKNIQQSINYMVSPEIK